MDGYEDNKTIEDLGKVPDVALDYLKLTGILEPSILPYICKEPSNHELEGK